MYKERDYKGIAAAGNEELLLSRQDEQLQHLNIRIARSGYYQQIRLFGNYAYKYPNYMFFSPILILTPLVRWVWTRYLLFQDFIRTGQKLPLLKREEAARSEVQVKENEIEEKVFRNYTQYNGLLDRFPVVDKAEELAIKSITDAVSKQSLLLANMEIFTVIGYVLIAVSVLLFCNRHLRMTVDIFKNKVWGS